MQHFCNTYHVLEKEPPPDVAGDILGFRQLAQPLTSDLRIGPAQIWEQMQDLNRLSQTYRYTHGVHNTALADPDGILLFRDDIGRHNAVDMIVGYSFLHDLSLIDKILITTGR